MTTQTPTSGAGLEEAVVALTLGKKTVLRLSLTGRHWEKCSWASIYAGDVILFEGEETVWKVVGGENRGVVRVVKTERPAGPEE